jgi:hypothetical protein
MYDTDSVERLSVERCSYKGKSLWHTPVVLLETKRVQCAMISRKKFYDMTYTFVTTQTTLSVILSAGLVAGRLPSVSSAQTKFGGHKFKRERDMKATLLDNRRYGLTSKGNRKTRPTTRQMPGCLKIINCKSCFVYFSYIPIISEHHIINNHECTHSEIIFWTTVSHVSSRLIYFWDFS